MNRREHIKWTISAAAAIGLGNLFLLGVTSCSENQKTSNFNVLDDVEVEILRILCDLFIPPGKEPGAGEVGVVSMIDQELQAFTTDQFQKELKEGLRNLGLVAEQIIGKQLSECNLKEKGMFMDFLVTNASQDPQPEKHLFFVLRNLISKAYFSSPVIRKEIVRYDPVPGKYQGCIQIEKGTKVWSLE